MTYRFYCSECNEEMDINIPIENYDIEKDNQVCPKCNKPLKRKIEFSGSISGHGDGWFGTSQGGWNS